MSLVNLDGGFIVPIGPGRNSQESNIANGSVTLDAAKEAMIFIGQVFTSDEGSHTIDTTGSSALGWRCGASLVFANALTSVSIGLAAVDLAVGPPGRAVNVTDVITFDVASVKVGGGGGLSTASWQNSVPTTGTKTIAHGDLVAFAIQMTARAGADLVNGTYHAVGTTKLRPIMTTYVGGVYAAGTGIPIVIITFSDGATGWFYGGEIASLNTTRTWNSSSSPAEYGQLFKLPFPTKIYGGYFWLDPDADCDFVLYEDPLGTPVAVRTTSFDANATSVATPRRGDVLFSSFYPYTAGQLIGAVLKPGASNVSTYFKTLADAAHRITDPWGLDGYGISRATGAFADANSSLDHYYIGLLCGAFDDGAGGGSGAHIASRQHLGM